jgi:hypothetical protein
MPLTRPRPELVCIPDFISKVNTTDLDLFLDYCDAGETGTTGYVIMGDRGHVYHAYFNNVSTSRTGTDTAAYNPDSSTFFRPAYGVRFVRTTGATTNNAGVIGLQLPTGSFTDANFSVSVDGNKLFYSTRMWTNSATNIVYRFCNAASLSTNIFTSTDAVGFEIDTSNSANWFILKGASGGSISREDTSIVFSASKCYVLSVGYQNSSTSAQYTIYEQSTADTIPSVVYQQTKTVNTQNSSAINWGVKTLENANKIALSDWLYVNSAVKLTPYDQAVRIPFQPNAVIP